MKLVLVLSCAMMVTVSGAVKEEAAGGASVANWLESASSTLLVLLCGNKAALLCTVIMVVMTCLYTWPQAAMTRRPLVVSGPIAQIQEETSKGMAYAAPQEDVNVAGSYAEAAERLKAQAEALRHQDDFQKAAELYLQAGVLLKAANAQARTDLVDALTADDDVDEQKQISQAGQADSEVERNYYKELFRVHDGAAYCYSEMAEKHAEAGNREQSAMMNLAAAVQLEASAKYAIRYGRREEAAEAYSFAAERYALVSDWSKAQSMRDAEAQQYALQAEVELAKVDCVSAAALISRAADASEQGGLDDKASKLRQIAAELYEAQAAESKQTGHKHSTALYYTRAASLYAKIESQEKVKSLREAASRVHEEVLTLREPWEMAYAGHEK